MEPNTSKKSVQTSYKDKLDEDNFSDGFFGLDLKKEGPLSNTTIVFFSLDMTDNKRYTNLNEICQIAAACRSNNGVIKKFHVYMKPEKYSIAPSISVSKGYKMGTDGRLLLGENEVEASTQRAGLEKFLNFLSDQTQRDGTLSVLLAAHKCDEIRRPVLLRHMAEYNLLPACQNLVLGFIDICPAIRIKIHERYNIDANAKDLWVTKLSKKYLSFEILRERADVTVETVLELINYFDCTNAMLADSVTLFNYDVYILLMDLMRNFPPAKVDFGLTRVLIRPNVQPAHLQNQVSVKTLNKIAVAGITTTMLLNEYMDKSDVSNLLELREVKTKRAVIRRINARLFAMTNAN